MSGELVADVEPNGRAIWNGWSLRICKAEVYGWSISTNVLDRHHRSVVVVRFLPLPTAFSLSRSPVQLPDPWNRSGFVRPPCGSSITSLAQPGLFLFPFRPQIMSLSSFFRNNPCRFIFFLPRIMIPSSSASPCQLLSRQTYPSSSAIVRLRTCSVIRTRYVIFVACDEEGGPTSSSESSFNAFTSATFPSPSLLPYLDPDLDPVCPEMPLNICTELIWAAVCKLVEAWHTK